MGLEFFGWAESCSASAGWNCRMKSHSAGTSPIFTTSWGTHLISSSNATACLSAPNHWVSGFEPLHWLASPAACRKSTLTKYCTGLFTISALVYNLYYDLILSHFAVSAESTASIRGLVRTRWWQMCSLLPSSKASCEQTWAIPDLVAGSPTSALCMFQGDHNRKEQIKQTCVNSGTSEVTPLYVPPTIYRSNMVRFEYGEICPVTQ